MENYISIDLEQLFSENKLEILSVIKKNQASGLKVFITTNEPYMYAKGALDFFGIRDIYYICEYGSVAYYNENNIALPISKETIKLLKIINHDFIDNLPSISRKANELIVSVYPKDNQEKELVDRLLQKHNLDSLELRKEEGIELLPKEISYKTSIEYILLKH